MVVLEMKRERRKDARRIGQLFGGGWAWEMWMVDA